MIATDDMRRIIAKRRGEVRKKKPGEAVVFLVSVVVTIAPGKMQKKETRTGEETEVPSSTKRGPSTKKDADVKNKILQLLE